MSSYPTAAAAVLYYIIMYSTAMMTDCLSSIKYKNGTMLTGTTRDFLTRQSFLNSADEIHNKLFVYENSRMITF